ncbi:MAG: hypothetical protein P8Y81_08390 [Ignavibacteriaceae bacterium]
MKKIFSLTALSLLSILIANSKTNSQSISQTLSVLSSDAAVQYSEPAIKAFEAAMNTGWFSGLPSADNGFHLKLRIVGIGSVFSNDIRKFSTMGEFRFSSEQVDEILTGSGYSSSDYFYNDIKNYILDRSWNVSIGGPTIIGSKDEYLKVKFPGGDIPVDLPNGSTEYYTVNDYSVTVQEVKGFLDNLSFLPTPALQLDFSSVLGTGLSFRYFNGINVENLGKIKIFGIGLVHNIKYWFQSSFPLNIGAAFYYQNFDVGSVFKNTATKVGVYFSKDIGTLIVFSPYTGISYESSTTRVNYNYKFDTPAGVQNVNIKVNYEPLNYVALTLGATIDFPVITLNFDFKFAETQAASIGLGFGF